VARGDIFPLNAVHRHFFVEMRPEYETEFETPDKESLSEYIFWSILSFISKETTKEIVDIFNFFLF
jgi:hypothetical protein